MIVSRADSIGYALAGFILTIAICGALIWMLSPVVDIMHGEHDALESEDAGLETQQHHRTMWDYLPVLIGVGALVGGVASSIVYGRGR